MIVVSVLDIITALIFHFLLLSIELKNYNGWFRSAFVHEAQWIVRELGLCTFLKQILDWNLWLMMLSWFTKSALLLPILFRLDRKSSPKIHIVFGWSCCLNPVSLESLLTSALLSTFLFHFKFSWKFLSPKKINDCSGLSMGPFWVIIFQSLKIVFVESSFSLKQSHWWWASESNFFHFLRFNFDIIFFVLRRRRITVIFFFISPWINNVISLRHVLFFNKNFNFRTWRAFSFLSFLHFFTLFALLRSFLSYSNTTIFLFTTWIRILSLLVLDLIHKLLFENFNILVIHASPFFENFVNNLILFQLRKLQPVDLILCFRKVSVDGGVWNNQITTFWRIWSWSHNLNLNIYTKSAPVFKKKA